MKDAVDLLARFFLAFIFIYEGLDSFLYFGKTHATLEAYGVTWHTDLIIVASIAFLIIGGLLVLIGYQAKLGAFLLLLYWVPFTFIVYSWWNDPIEYRREHALYFMRNLGVCSGLLLIMAHGVGKYSVRRMFYLPKSGK